MLSVDRAGARLSPDLLRAPGGFLWWYADATNSQGDGFVCIWSFGLPFLPGLASSARAGSPTEPAARPSLNLSVYRGGKQTSYHLIEFEPSRVRWHGDRWSFGDSELSFREDGDAGELEATLRFAIPGDDAELRGRFVLRGVRARWANPKEAAADAHRWAPVLAHAHATATITVGDTELLQLGGPGEAPASGYHDRNGSPRSLHALGIHHWVWGRAELAGETVIVYLSWPEAEGERPELLLGLGTEDGSFTFGSATVRLQTSRMGWFGMPWWREITVEGLDRRFTLTLSPPADDGPFYLRCAMTLRSDDGRHGVGWAELCRPSRIDGPLLRPLVRMAVQPQTGRGSLWLPLFNGPQRDRWRRLLRGWAARLRGYP
jgi:carotenoid 1,2-hydratase